MNIIFKILIAIVVFGTLVFIHEFGHFICAKLSGVKVNQFALGMGPALIKKQKGETLYALRLFPIGGFVSMEGEDEHSENSRAFCNKPVWKRMIIVIAGAVMNLIFGLILLTILTSQYERIPTTTIGAFKENAVSSSLLKKDDKIIRINGCRIFTYDDIVFEMIRDSDASMDITVLRDGQKITIDNVKFESEEYEDGTIGILIDFKVYGKDKNILTLPAHALSWTGSIIKQVYVGLLELISGKVSLNQLSGPVGVTSALGEASSMGFSTLLLVVAYITVNLGVVNLMPFPALDGGRFIFLIIEAIFRKPVNPKYEGYIHAGGLIALLILMVFITYNDIVRIFFKR